MDGTASRLGVAILILAVILLVLWAVFIGGGGRERWVGGPWGRGWWGSWGRGWWGPWGRGWGGWGWPGYYENCSPWHAGGSGLACGYYGPAPYLADYADLRPCPADPTGGGTLCTGEQEKWPTVDKCRGRGLAGDAAYVWREGPEGGRCYSFYP